MSLETVELQTGHNVAVLREDLVEVWWAQLAHADDALVELLDEQERRRLAQYRKRDDATRFLLGRAVVRLVAGRHLAQPPATVSVDQRCGKCGRQHGKVTLPGSGLEVSVAHSGDRVGVAFRVGGAVGLDVEFVDRQLEVDSLSQQVLATSEDRSLRQVPAAARTRAFLCYWTRKEAIVKATGDGLSTPLAAITVSSHDQAPALLAWPARPDLISGLRLFDLPGDHAHVAAVATVGTGDIAVLENDAGGLLAASAP